MEKHVSQVSPGAAGEQLSLARRAHAVSVRRATTPAGLILVVSFFSGVLTLTPAQRGPGHVLTIIAVAGLVLELVRLSARNHWEALRSLPQPKWNLTELAFMGLALIVAGLIGPHLLADRNRSELVSYVLGAAVMVTVAVLLFAANMSYRRRNSRAWRR
jgi:hypothetical protein